MNLLRHKFRNYVPVVFFSVVILFLSFSSTNPVPKTFAACTAGSECEQGNATACNPNGSNTGKICHWTCSASGAYQCTGCSGTCGGSSTSVTKPPASNNNNNNNSNNNKANPGDRCGVNGVNTCVSSTNGYGSCSSAGAGVCGNGGAKLYCCAAKPAATTVASTTTNPAQIGDRCGVNGVNQCVASTNGYTGCNNTAGAGVCGNGGAKLYCCPTKNAVTQVGSKCGVNGVNICVSSNTASKYPSGSCSAPGAGVCGNGGAKYLCCPKTVPVSTSGTKNGAPVVTNNTNGTANSGSNNAPVNTAPTGWSCQCNSRDAFYCIPTGGNVGLPNVSGSCTAVAANSNGLVPPNAICGLGGVTQLTSSNVTTVAQTMCTATNASNTVCSYGGSLSCTNICKNISAGGYCGGTIGGDGSYVYTCDGSGKVTAGKQCGASGCQVNPPGTPDCCKGTAGCNASTAVGNITAVSVTASALLASNVLAAQAVVLTDNLNYDAATNTFSNPSFKVSNLQPGTYNLFLHVNGYLDKELANNSNNTFTITAGQTVLNVGPVSLTQGDIAPQPTGDNIIDIQDFNAVVGCLGSNAVSPTCINKAAADINHDGIIDNKDLTIIQNNFNETGDSITVNPNTQQGNDSNPTGSQTNPNHIPTFTCVTDPSCAAKNTGSMQICPLKCTPQ